MCGVCATLAGILLAAAYLPWLSPAVKHTVILRRPGLCAGVPHALSGSGDPTRAIHIPVFYQNNASTTGSTTSQQQHATA